MSGKPPVPNTDTPTALVSDIMNREKQLEAHFAQLLGEQGAWARFTNASEELAFIVDTYLPHMQPHYPDFSQSEIREITVSGSSGLEGERMNGPGNAVRSYFNSKYEQILPFMDRAKAFLDTFDQKSDLVSTSDDLKRLVQKYEKHRPGISNEIKREAFARCADEIDAWVKYNQKALAGDAEGDIRFALDEYRASLGVLLAEVDLAKGEYNQISGSLKI